MKMVNAKGEAVYFNRAWKHGKETWVVQGIGETLVIGRDRQKRRSRTFTQLPQAEKYLPISSLSTLLAWDSKPHLEP